MMMRCAGLALTVLLCSCATAPKSKFDSMSDRSRRWVATADAYAIDVLPGELLDAGQQKRFQDWVDESKKEEAKQQ